MDDDDFLLPDWDFPDDAFDEVTAAVPGFEDDRLLEEPPRCMAAEEGDEAASLSTLTL